METIKPEYLDSKIIKKLSSVLLLIGVSSFLISLYFLFDNQKHFFFSYLTSFAYFLSISLGSMFLILIFALTRAGWCAVIRRAPELMMKNIGIIALLFIPLLFGLHDLYHWTHHDAVATDVLLQLKQPYLNVPFFVIRAILFFGIWIWLANAFFKRSIKQDETGDKSLTLENQKMSTYGILLFALTLTFCSIDWFMSLTPHWFSTMFGVYFFAGSTVAALALTIILFAILKKNGLLKNIVSVEHFHDLGKLLYGFNVFWAYIAFCQYFLIWYANIPEETEFFIHHFTGTWKTVGIVLAVGHFAIPFVLFMSRHVKRNIKLNVFFSSWLLIMHFLDLYWLIMPTYDHHGIHASAVDFLIFIALGCFYFASILRLTDKKSLFPVQDPRLKESIKFTNF